MAEKEKEKGKNNELINKLYQVVDCFNENMKRLISGGFLEHALVISSLVMEASLGAD